MKVANLLLPALAADVDLEVRTAHLLEQLASGGDLLVQPPLAAVSADFLAARHAATLGAAVGEVLVLLAGRAGVTQTLDAVGLGTFARRYSNDLEGLLGRVPGGTQDKSFTWT